jgi:hypothetical protein
MGEDNIPVTNPGAAEKAKKESKIMNLREDSDAFQSIETRS